MPELTTKCPTRVNPLPTARREALAQLRDRVRHPPPGVSLTTEVHHLRAFSLDLCELVERLEAQVVALDMRLQLVARRAGEAR